MSAVLINQLPLKLLSFSSCKSVNLPSISTASALFAVPKIGSSGNPLGRKRFRRPNKSTDAEYIVSHVAGSNYMVNGEDVKIKDDSEYPDWIWNLNLGRPKQPDELEYGTKEYWEALKYNNWVKFMRLQGCLPKRKMTRDEEQLRELQWKMRIRNRALASDDVDAGLDPDDYKQRPQIKMLLRPNQILEEEDLHPDEVIAKNPENFIKISKPHDFYEQIAPKSRVSKRGRGGFFPSPSTTSVHPESFLSKLPNIQELSLNSQRKRPAVPRLEQNDRSEPSG